jgi:hypothetical protein
MWLDERQIEQVMSIDDGDVGLPVPTRMISNGEFLPIAQTPDQKRVECEFERRIAQGSRKLGMSRRDFLRSGIGTATAFAAMNAVFGTYFNDADAAAIDPDLTAALRRKVKDQLVIDVQLHFVRDDYKKEVVLHLGEYAKNYTSRMAGRATPLAIRSRTRRIPGAWTTKS